ncbi:hypothetical protein LCGC14_1343710 [marine sediment metagenome]|uniref:Uncharacterized protein n=1 Tax=marine sediment metagenome TaxID=412755 RepID=A0A0F9KZA0_9ZZZZ
MIAVAAPCVHHDIIEMPHGPVCIGVCKYCGREKEYENHKFPDYNSRPTKRVPLEDQVEMVYD